MIPLRPYTKPQLLIEAFDVDDVITASGLIYPGAAAEETPNGAALAFDEAAGSAEKTTLFPQGTVADPSGVFQQQVTGGNVLQEGLNNLYENFLAHF